MIEQNKAIFRRFVDEAWNKRNKAICDELLTADFEHTMPGASAPIKGVDGYKQLIDMFLSGFPDTSFEIQDVFGEGDRVCLVWVARGTHQGVFSGLPPTGNRVEVNGVGVAYIRGAQIFKMVSAFDNATLGQQIGMDGAKAAEAW